MVIHCGWINLEINIGKILKTMLILNISWECMVLIIHFMSQLKLCTKKKRLFIQYLSIISPIKQ